MANCPWRAHRRTKEEPEKVTMVHPRGTFLTNMRRIREKQKERTVTETRREARIGVTRRAERSARWAANWTSSDEQIPRRLIKRDARVGPSEEHGTDKKPLSCGLSMEEEDVHDARYQLDPSEMLAFLRARADKVGRPIADGLGSPERCGDGWVCMPQLSARRKEEERTADPEWPSALHGTPVGCLYSVLYHDTLLESRNRDRGERFLTGRPGVYVYHRDYEKAMQKASSYSTPTPVTDTGAFWQCVVEVGVDGRMEVRRPGHKKHYDQRVYKAKGTYVRALWTRGYRPGCVPRSVKYLDTWDGESEVDPCSQQIAVRLEDQRQANEKPDNGALEAEMRTGCT